MSLKEYTRKRISKQPRSRKPKSSRHSFVIQNHDASRLHYDLRLRWLLNKPPGVIRYSAALGNDAASLLEQARELGLEGLIGKRKDSIYEVGLRSGDWIKLKLLKEQEFVIGGYTEPEGTGQFCGSIIVGFYRGKKPIFAGKVSTGAPLTAGAIGPRHYRFGDEALPLGGTPNGLSGQIRRVDAG